VAVLGRNATVDEVNAAMRQAAEGSLKGILAYTEEPLVSSDLKSNTHSSIYSALDTQVVSGNMVKAVSWYDNEWGYSCRVSDLAAYMAERL
jgi:glyceraldehyde 3-phosphate dehydrogenase (phosphorylating)